MLNGLLQADNQGVRADCHTITHNIGSATLARYKGDAAEAIGSGGAMQDATMCGSGFYHGLIEYALREAANPKELVAKVKGMCADAKALPTTFARYQCLHGLGHGVMIFSGDNLPWALGHVRQARRQLVGAVMQRRRLHAELQPAGQALAVPVGLREEERPALPVRLGARRSTSSTATSRSPSTSSPRPTTTGRAPPRRAPRRRRRGTGSASSPTAATRRAPPHYHADVADGYCKLTGKQIAQCIYGVARDFANNDAGGTRAADFCNLQSAGTLRGFCFYAVGTILGTLGHPDSWIKSTCATLAGRYAPECAGKVDAAEFKLINNGTPGS